jgi:two-component system, NarL family, invasion response regulator UvrY
MPDILLVDDHLVIISGLKIVMENFLANCKIDVASDGDSAFEKIKEHHYDLIILDISLPNTDTYDLVQNILAEKPEAHILMFSMNPEELYAKRYIRMGALGYLSKTATLDEIKIAIESTLQNKRYLSPGLKKKLAMDVLDNKEDGENQFNKLSPREFQIMQLLVQGDSVGEMSKKLNLHTSTIGTHKARIFEKLQCHNIVELSIIAKLNNVKL